MIAVNIPSPLRSYTGGKSSVQAQGKTIGGTLVDLEGRHPGILFRIIDEQGHVRQHIKFYINKDPGADLTKELTDGDTLHIICALSGG